MGMKRSGLLTALACFLIVMTAVAFYIKFINLSSSQVKIVPFADSPGIEAYPAFSPEGDQIAYAWNGPDRTDYHLYVKRIGAGAPIRLTRSTGNHIHPTWSPDGRRLAFLRFSGRESGICQIPAQGGVEQRLLAIDPSRMGNGLDWSPDGGFLVYACRTSMNTPAVIRLLSLEDRENRQISFPPEITLGDDGPRISPDGRWVAFRRSFSYTASDIFIIPSAGGRQKRVTLDNQEITDLAWSPDGSEIIFSSGRGGGPGRLLRTQLRGGESRSIPRVGGDAASIAVSKKGRRLAYAKWGTSAGLLKDGIPGKEGQAAKRPGEAGELDIHLVENFR